MIAARCKYGHALTEANRYVRPRTGAVECKRCKADSTNRWKKGLPTEETVETYFKRRVEETGGEVRKVVFQGRRGAPDRLAGWPNGRHGLVELKRPRGTPEPHQLREHVRLRSIGLPVDVVDTKQAVDMYVERMSR